MDNTKKVQAEKLQIKLDKLLENKEKKQIAFDKAKQELNGVSKEVDTVKLKLFEILQSGYDDSAFSNWAKKKINEKGENDNSVNPDKHVSQNQQSQTEQNQQLHTGENAPLNTSQNHNRPNHQKQN